MRRLLTVSTLWTALLVVAGACAAATVGPDVFGYTASDAVVYNFTDISGTGTRVLVNQDDTAILAGLGFNFTFYGRSYPAVCFSPNGLLSFTNCSTQFTNVDLTTSPVFGNGPHGSVDVPAIAVLWDDWQFFQTGADAAYYFQVTGAVGSRQLIIQWNRAGGFASSPAFVTFQVILFEGSGDILMQYKTTDSGDFRANGASATVGIRDASGQTNGRRLQWSYNLGVITAGKAIRFFSPTPHGNFLPGLYGHHPNHPHHGEHGHTEPGNGTPPHVPGHSPGLTADPSGGVVEPVLVAGWNEDGTVNANPAARGLAGTNAVRPARRGGVVQFFGTAAGITLRNQNGDLVEVDPARFTAPAAGGALYWTRQVPVVKVGGVPAQVFFSGMAPGLTGVWQINVRIPEGAPAGDQTAVEVSYDGRVLVQRAVVAVEE